MREPEPFTIRFIARVRAMRSMLFSRARIEDILDQRDLAVTIELLLNSIYGVEMAQALAQFQGADAVEDAVTRNLSTTFQKLVYRAPGRFRELTAIFLLRWDLAAVKSLLRHVHSGAREPAALFTGATMTTALQQELAKSASMGELVGALTLWNPELCSPMTQLLRSYQQHPDLAPLEEALDRSYFVGNVDRLHSEKGENAAQLVKLLHMEVDRINLRILVLMLDARTPPDVILARLMPGGTLSRRALSRMAGAQGVVELMELLGRTMYRDLVEVMFPFVQRRLFSPIERYFELTLMRELRRMARRSPLSIAILMDYAWLKYNEVTNLRLIARGEARHLPRGRVREELLFV